MRAFYCFLKVMFHLLNTAIIVAVYVRASDAERAPKTLKHVMAQADPN